jgi:preprotein translocase subunit SecF
MQALAKRVEARGTASNTSSSVSTGSVSVQNGRGPRNQPKRKGRK